jgi:Glycosyl transferase family 2
MSSSSRLAPRVTVVVPNYNHARFLPARLDSILRQSFSDFELLFLDDASTDDSLDVLSFYMGDPRVTVSVNKENSGSPFKQWNRGVARARGEYVWIAESDDVADPRFLETLIAVLDRSTAAGLAYCRSVIIDRRGRFIGKWRPVRKPKRWDHDFTNDGKAECRDHLIFENTIPNASAVLFRRALFELVGGAPDELRLTGDWLLWARVLAISSVAYAAAPLSSFRTHAGSVRSASSRSGIVVQECLRIVEEISRMVPLPAERTREALEAQIDVWLIENIRYGISYSRNREILRHFGSLLPHVQRVIARRLLWPLPKTLLERTLFLVRRHMAVCKRQPLPSGAPAWAEGQARHGSAGVTASKE